MLGVRVPPGLPFRFKCFPPEFEERFKQIAICEVLTGKKMNDFLEKTKGTFRGAGEFLKDTRKELHNVSWPPRREVTGTTLVVVVAVFFFGFFLYLIDTLVNTGMNLLFRRVS